jgi:hypothetical protein
MESETNVTNEPTRERTNEPTLADAMAMDSENLAAVFKRAAKLMKAGPPAVILKYKRGKWTIRGANGADKPMNGSRLIALVTYAQCGWSKWDNQQLVDQHLGYYAQGFKPPERHELGDMDQSQWYVSSSGRARDPWSLGSHLPLIDPRAGTLYIFSTTSKGGVAAIGSLFDAFADQLLLHPGSKELPLLELSSDGYDHQEYGWTDVPQFDIVGWEAVDPKFKLPAHVPTPPLPKPEALPRPAIKPVNVDIDDSIPF